MTRCSKSLQPDVHVSRKRLADGSIKEYHYPRNRPRSSRYGADSVAALIAAWKISPEWAAFSPITVGGYTTYLRDLELLARMKAADVTRRDILSVRDAIASARGNGAATGFVRAAGAEVRNLGDVRWMAVEDGSQGKGTGRHVAAFILRGSAP